MEEVGKKSKPSGSEKRQKNLFIRGRVNEEEKKEVVEKASKAGMTEGEFVRSRCLDKVKTRAARRPTVELENLSRLLGELGKVGSNLNQIAKTLNAGGWASGNEVNKALRELQGVSAAILDAMGRKAGANDNRGKQN